MLLCVATSCVEGSPHNNPILLCIQTFTIRRPCSDECGNELYQDVPQKTFLPLTKCQSQQCTTNGVTGRIMMQTRGSKFTKYQELRVQELPEQVPVGHIPRSMTVIARGEVTRECIPGDITNITGECRLPLGCSGVFGISTHRSGSVNLGANP